MKDYMANVAVMVLVIVGLAVFAALLSAPMILASYYSLWWLLAYVITIPLIGVEFAAFMAFNKWLS